MFWGLILLKLKKNVHHIFTTAIISLKNFTPVCTMTPFYKSRKIQKTQHVAKKPNLRNKQTNGGKQKVKAETVDSRTSKRKCEWGNLASTAGINIATMKTVETFLK